MNAGGRQPEGDLADVMRVLDDAAAREIDALDAEGAALVDGETEARARQSMEAIMEGKPVERGSRLGAAAWVAAAAVLVAVGFALSRLWPSDPTTPADFALGSREQPEIVAPVGAVAGYTDFDWRGELLADELFEIAVWNRDGSALPVVTHQLRATTWRPSAAEKERLGARIRWEVRILDSSNAVRTHASAEASLAP